MSSHRLSGCEGKAAYTSWPEAERKAKRMRRRHESESMHPYRCRICGNVHVGTGEAVRDVRKFERAMAKVLKG